MAFQICLLVLIFAVATPTLSWAQDQTCDSSTHSGGYSGGSGDSGDPYQIADFCDLIVLSKSSGDWNSHFIQTADIAFNADETTVDWDGDGSLEHGSGEDDAKGFSPIGSYDATPFTGVYDGNGHVIDQLHIKRPTQEMIGLFGATDDQANIKNLGVINADISAQGFVGILVGYLDKTDGSGPQTSLVEETFVTGVVRGESNTGGLVGKNNDEAVIKDSYSTACVVRLSDSTSGSFGSLVGFNHHRSTTNRPAIQSSYATGNVTDGDCDSGAKISPGGFVGEQVSGGDFTDNFVLAGLATGSIIGASAKSLTALKDQSTYTNWDFAGDPADGVDEAWLMTNGEYPRLAWEDKDTLTADQLHWGGLGTRFSPFQIDSPEDLIAISKNLEYWDKHFVQTADIVFNADKNAVDWDGNGSVEGGLDGSGWKMLGSFSGTYDGQGHVISNIYRDDDSGSNVGEGDAAFIDVLSGTVRNLVLTGVTMIDEGNGERKGGFANVIEASAVVERVGLEGEFRYTTTATYEFFVGGFAGEIHGTIRESYALINDLTIGAKNDRSSGRYVGGFAGKLSGTAVVEDVYVAGKLDIYRPSDWESHPAETALFGFGFSDSNNLRRLYVSVEIPWWDSGATTYVGPVSNSGFSDLNFYNEDLDGPDVYRVSTNAKAATATPLTEKQSKTPKPFYSAGWDLVSESVNGSEDIWDFDQTETVNNGFPIFSWQTGADDQLSPFDGGVGTRDRPFLVRTPTQLLGLSKFSKYWDSHFLQTSDIDFHPNPPENWAGDGVDWDLDGADDDTSTSGFSPIGLSGSGFSGTYDGDGFEIKNLYIDRNSSDDVGLFGYTDGAMLTNVFLTDPVISGRGDVGALVGDVYSATTIRYVLVSNPTISNSNIRAGGVAGRVDSNSLLDMVGVDGLTLDAGNRLVGGLVGFLRDSTIKRSFARGKIDTSSNDAGGLVGQLGTQSGTKVTLFDNYAAVAITIDSDAGDQYNHGGLIGGATGATIAELTNNYAAGTVANSQQSGGMFGNTASDTVVENGSNNFWDKDKVSQGFGDDGTTPLKTDSTLKITGKTTTEMQTVSTFTDAGWDFAGDSGDGVDEVWLMDDGVDTDDPIDGSTDNDNYPFLAWEVIDTLQTDDLHLGGLGTRFSPFQLDSAEDLIAISQESGYWDKHFIQIADIIFNPDETLVDWDGDGNADGSNPAGFSPIGSDSGEGQRFIGAYDGQGHTIENLYINRGDKFLGLFGYVRDATLSNLMIRGEVTSTESSGGGRTGLLAGFMIDSNVQSVGVEGSVTDADSPDGDRKGGLVGQMADASTIADSFAHVIVSSQSDDELGGLVGRAEGAIDRSFSTGTVTSINDQKIGGLAGEDDTSLVASGSYYLNTAASKSAVGDPKTATELKQIGTFSTWSITKTYSDAASDPSLIWGICEGSSFPYLLNQYASDPCVLSALGVEVVGSDNTATSLSRVIAADPFGVRVSAFNGFDQPLVVDSPLDFSLTAIHDPNNNASSNLAEADTSASAVSLTGTTAPFSAEIAAGNAALVVNNLVYTQIDDNETTQPLRITASAMTPDGVQITGFQELPADASEVVLTLPGSSVSVDSSTSITATVQSAGTNATVLEGQAVTLTTDFGSFSNSTIEQTTTATTNSNGQITATLYSTTPGTATITASSCLDNCAVTQADNKTVEFEPGALASFDIASIPDTTAGVGFSTSVTALDQYGNVITTDQGIGSPTPTLSPATTSGNTTGPTLNAFSDGVASLTGTIQQTGTYSIDVADGSVSQTSNTFAITPASPDDLVIESGDNQSADVLTALGAPLEVKVVDAFDNPISGQAVSWDTGGEGSIQPDNAVTDSNGEVTATWTLGPVAGAQTAQASVSGLTSVTFDATADAGPAARLQLNNLTPNSVDAGTTFSVDAIITDAQGNAVLDSEVDDTLKVSLMDASGTATQASLAGTTQQNATTATTPFSDLSITEAGAYTIRVQDTASKLGFGLSAPVTITPAAADAAQSSLSVDPNALASNGEATAEVMVTVRDQYGNVRTSGGDDVFITASSGQVSEVTDQQDGTYTATLTSSTEAGDHTVTAYLGTDATGAKVGGTAGDQPIRYTVGVPHQLSVVAGPQSSTTAGDAITTNDGSALAFAIEDVNGNRIEDAIQTVSVRLSRDKGATLSGTLSQAAVDGVARFGDLSIDLAGGYSLTATATGLEEAITEPLRIEVGPPAEYALSLAPSKQLRTVPFAVTATLTDRMGNPVVSETSRTFEVSASPINDDADGNAGAFYQDTPTNTTPTGTLSAGESNVAITGLIYTGLSDINKAQDLTLRVAEPGAGGSTPAKTSTRPMTQPTGQATPPSTAQATGLDGEITFAVRDIEIVLDSVDERILVGGDEAGAEANTQTVITATLKDINGDPVPYTDLFVSTSLGSLEAGGTALTSPGAVMTDDQGQIEVVLASGSDPGEAMVVVQTPGASQSAQAVQVITPPTKLTDYSPEPTSGGGDTDSGDNGDNNTGDNNTGGDTGGGTSSGDDPNAPTVEDYENAGVTGVDEGNVDDINEIIGKLPPGDKDSLDEIQSTVDAYNALLDTVDDPNSDLDLTAADYQAMGFDEVDTSEEVFELNKRLAKAKMSEIDTYAKLKAFIEAILAFVFQRALPIPLLGPLSQWVLIGTLLAVGLMAARRRRPGSMTDHPSVG